MSRENDNNEGIRILILEGAGVKGLSQLSVLGEIMNRIQEEEGLDDAPDPCEWLDAVAGVDTAAMIATLIGKLHMPIEKAVQRFKKLGEEVYSSKKTLSKSAGST
ncbi:hypothetical protein FRC07_013417, partial [Ceratobasidium sp. 392]